MGAGSANLISETSTQSLRLGVVISTVEHVYLVITDNDTDNSAVVLGASNLPAMRSGFYFSDGPVYCVSRKPYRVDAVNSRRKWNVACTFTNDNAAFSHDSDGSPISNPVSITPRIQVDYIKREEPITDAQWQSVTIGPFHESHQPTGSNPFAADPTKLMQPGGWMPRVTGPITNSAGDPRFATSPRFSRRLTLTRYLRTWDDALFDYLGAVNDDTVTVKQFDGPATTGESGDPNLRYNATFPALTLRVADIKKEDVWLAGDLYFRASIVVEENKRTWVHSELDVGQRQRIFSGQNKLDGTTWTTEELATLNPPIPEFGYGYAPIVQNGVAVADRVKLNGFGAPLPIIRDPNGEAVPEDGDCIYVNFRIGGLIDYADLGFE